MNKAIIINGQLSEYCIDCKELLPDKLCNADNCNIRDGEMDTNYPH